MTIREEFTIFFDTMHQIWGVPFDDSKASTWFSILGNLKVRGLVEAVRSLAKECHFPPSINQVVERYDELKKRSERAIRDRKIEAQNRLIASQTGGQYECPICENVGDVYFEKNGHNYHARCTCSRGRDLSKWSESQITKGLLWVDPDTGKHKDLYVPDISDALTEEEIEILKAKALSKKAAAANMSPEKVALIIKQMTAAMAV